jgi:hypothetical protein
MLTGLRTRPTTQPPKYREGGGRWPRSLAPFLLLLATAASVPASAAVFNVTSGACTGAGSITEAVADANQTPGTDTISIQAGLQIDLGDCGPTNPDPVRFYAAQATESVVIEGNGATVRGTQVFISRGGILNPNRCPDARIGDLIDAVIPGFLLIGELNTDNSGISVAISDLTADGLSAFVHVEDGAKFEGDQLRLLNIRDQFRSCTRGVIDADDRTEVRITNSLIEDFANYDVPLFNFNSIAALNTSGTLYLSDSTFTRDVGFFASNAGGAVFSFGGTVRIVNSLIQNGGLSFTYNTDAQIVNSAVQFGINANEPSRIYSTDGSRVRLEASTVVSAFAACGRCPPPPADPGTMPFVAGSGGTFELVETAIGTWDPSFPGAVLYQAENGLYTADTLTHIVPVTGQDAVALRAITQQPGLLTAPPSLPDLQTGVTLTSIAEYKEWITPLSPGELIDRVGNAGPGGTNELINPIDNMPLTTDVFGNPRVDANGSRNIGAVQLALAPALTASAGDALASLNWTRPQAPPNQSITGYDVCVRPTGDPCTSWQSISTDPAVIAGQVSPLVNGTTYDLEVRARYGPAGTGPFGPPSNLETVRPCGFIGAPTLTATPGDAAVTLDWTRPDDGGCGLDGYILESGTPIGVNFSFTTLGVVDANTLQRLVSGLRNSRTYKFAIRGFRGSEVGPQGLSQAVTPWPLPTLSYANPTTWPQNTPLTLTPTVTQLQGSGAYTIESGALPDGMTLDPGTGVISGTPTTQQSTSATIRLTDGATGLFTEATVPLTIVAPSASPLLWYPVIQATVGVGPVSATPTQSGIPADATFSVLAGDSLPAGFSIDPNTGVISGTATSAPGQVVDITIQACWGGCGPGEARLAPMLFWILPRLQYPTLTEATAGVPTSVTPTVDLWSGGQFSIDSGSLPAGMSLDPATGVISGTPQTLGVYSVKVRYSTGVNVLLPPLEFVYAGTQINVFGPTITLTYPAITAFVGERLLVLPGVSGLSGNVVYSIAFGSLPQGLRLDPDTGAITGVPTDRPGGYPVVIQVTDPYGSQRTSVVIDLQTSAPMPVPIFSLPALALLVILFALMGGWARSRRRINLT